MMLVITFCVGVCCAHFAPELRVRYGLATAWDPLALSDFPLPATEEWQTAERKTDDVIGQNHSSIVQEVTFSQSYRSKGTTLSSTIRPA